MNHNYESASAVNKLIHILNHKFAFLQELFYISAKGSKCNTVLFQIWLNLIHDIPNDSYSYSEHFSNTLAQMFVQAKSG